MNISQSAETRITHADDRSGPLDDLIARNRSWVQRKTRADPRFFERLVGQQHPDYFWIGCSDSRVPATEIVDLDPGEMFVHRNVANLAPERDPNFSAALLFAVDVLRVRHVIVVGHYGCGGVHAAPDAEGNDPIGRWLAPLRALYSRHRSSLMALDSDSVREDRLCELNVVEQVNGLSYNPIITRAWQNGRDLTLHGLIYAIGDGLIGSVCPAISSPADRPSEALAPASDDDELDPNIL